jgi:3-hydroxy-D-aspartate aldolase
MPALERNEAAMRALVRGSGVRLRPHGKLHKSSAFAKWLLAQAGNEIVGLCAQTVQEAEVFVKKAGVSDVLVTNQVVSPLAVDKLVNLAAGHPQATIGILLDSLANAQSLSAAASQAAVSLDAYVEVLCTFPFAGRPTHPTRLFPCFLDENR